MGEGKTKTYSGREMGNINVNTPQMTYFI